MSRWRVTRDCCCGREEFPGGSGRHCVTRSTMRHSGKGGERTRLTTSCAAYDFGKGESWNSNPERDRSQSQLVSVTHSDPPAGRHPDPIAMRGIERAFKTRSKPHVVRTFKPAMTAGNILHPRNALQLHLGVAGGVSLAEDVAGTNRIYLPRGKTFQATCCAHVLRDGAGLLAARRL